MSVKKASYAAIFTAGVLLLSACGGEPTPDPGASETTATPSATPSATPTPTPTPTPTYAVGDPGPGGGIIYYVDNVGFSCGESYSATGSPTGGLCKYLEVAPGGWNATAETAGLIWAVAANQAADVSGIANDVSGIENEIDSVYNNALGIGLGYKNSDLIVAQGNDTTTAAGAARAYTNNAKTDWYLPTTAELNLLCQWNRGVPQDVEVACTGGIINTGTGASGSGFVDYAYWSSSEVGAEVAYFQSFIDGLQYDYYKDFADYVRPVRAF